MDRFKKFKTLSLSSLFNVVVLPNDMERAKRLEEQHKNALQQLFLMGALINILIEVFVIYLLGFRKKEDLIVLSTINLVTWPLFIVSIDNLTRVIPLFVLDPGSLLLIMEVCFVLFETVVFSFIRKYPVRTVFPRLLLANVISAYAGLLISNYL